MQIYCKYTTNVTIRLNKRHICKTLNTIFKEKKYFSRIPLEWGFQKYYFYSDIFRFSYCKYCKFTVNTLQTLQID